MEGTEDEEKEKDKISKGRSSLYAGAFLTAVGVSLAIATGGSILLAVPICLGVGAAIGVKFPKKIDVKSKAKYAKNDWWCRR